MSGRLTGVDRVLGAVTAGVPCQVARPGPSGRRTNREWPDPDRAAGGQIETDKKKKMIFLL